MAISMLHPACEAQVQLLAMVIGADIEYSTDRRVWAAQGQMTYALAKDLGLAPTDENVQKYGALVRRETHRLVLPKLRSGFAYAVAMHELGHAYAGVNELEAWLWAYENALYWTSDMLRLAVRAVCSYYRAYPDQYPEVICLAVLASLVPFGPVDTTRRQVGE